MTSLTCQWSLETSARQRYDTDINCAGPREDAARAELGRRALMVPRAEIPDLFDHLIRPEQERFRDGQAEGLGGLEIDDQLELRGLLHGEIGGLGPLEDLVHEVGGALVHPWIARPEGHQAARIDQLRVRIHSRD